MGQVGRQAGSNGTVRSGSSSSALHTKICHAFAFPLAACHSPPQRDMHRGVLGARQSRPPLISWLAASPHFPFSTGCLLPATLPGRLQPLHWPAQQLDQLDAAALQNCSSELAGWPQPWAARTTELPCCDWLLPLAATAAAGC